MYAPLLAIGESFSAEESGSGTEDCSKVTLVLVQNNHLLRLLGNTPNSTRCVELYSTALPTTRPLAPVNVALNVRETEPGVLRATIAVDGLLTSASPVDSELTLAADTLKQKLTVAPAAAGAVSQWRGTVHHIAAYLGRSIGNTDFKAITNAVLPVLPPRLAPRVAAKADGSVTAMAGGLLVAEHSGLGFTVGSDIISAGDGAISEVTVSSVSSESFWACYSLTVTPTGSDAAVTISESSQLPVTVSSSSVLTVTSTGDYKTCITPAPVATHINVVARTVILPSNAAASAPQVTANETRYSSWWPVAQSVAVSVSDASPPTAVDLTTKLTARTRRWLEPFTGANNDASLQMISAKITALPSSSAFALYSWDAQAAALGPASEAAAAKVLNESYWQRITAVPFTVAATKLPGETASSFKVAVKHTYTTASTVAPAAPLSSAELEASAFTFTVTSENGRESEPTTRSLSAETWVTVRANAPGSSPASVVSVQPLTTTVITAPFADAAAEANVASALGHSQPAESTTPDYISLVITSLPTVGTLMVPVTHTTSINSADNSDVSEYIDHSGVDDNAQRRAKTTADVLATLSQTHPHLKTASFSTKLAALVRLTGRSPRAANRLLRGGDDEDEFATAATPVAMRNLTEEDLPFATAGPTVTYRAPDGVQSRLNAPVSDSFTYFAYDRRYGVAASEATTTAVTLAVITNAPKLRPQTTPNVSNTGAVTDAEVKLAYNDEESALRIKVGSSLSLNMTFSDSDEGDMSASTVDVVITCNCGGLRFSLNGTQAETSAIVLESTELVGTLSFSARMGNLQSALDLVTMTAVGATGSGPIRVTATATETSETGKGTASTAFYVNAWDIKYGGATGFSGIIFTIVMFVAVPVVGLVLLWVLLKCCGRRIKRALCGPSAKEQAELDAKNKQEAEAVKSSGLANCPSPTSSFDGMGSFGAPSSPSSGTNNFYIITTASPEATLSAADVQAMLSQLPASPNQTFTHHAMAVTMPANLNRKVPPLPHGAVKPGVGAPMPPPYKLRDDDVSGAQPASQ
mgnify:CR=1 FL=1